MMCLEHKWCVFTQQEGEDAQTLFFIDDVLNLNTNHNKKQRAL